MYVVEERSLNDLGTKQLDKHELLPAKSPIQIRLSEFIKQIFVRDIVTKKLITKKEKHTSHIFAYLVSIDEIMFVRKRICFS